MPATLERRALRGVGVAREKFVSICVRRPRRRNPIHLPPPADRLRSCLGRYRAVHAEGTQPGPAFRRHLGSASARPGGRARAKSNACSVPTAPARRRRSTCSSAFSNRVAALPSSTATEVARDPRTARAHLAYVPEQVSLYPTLTGLENLVYFTRLAGKAGRDTAQLEALLDEVELRAARRIARRALLERNATESRTGHRARKGRARAAAGRATVGPRSPGGERVLRAAAEAGRHGRRRSHGDARPVPRKGDSPVASAS